jgi:serine/threonine-protein kinase
MRETPVRIGSYEIVIELAAGGMATTYIAHKRGDAFFERLVAVKRIHPWLLDDSKSGDMLREEARLGAAIQHPHVVHVEDVTVNAGEVCLIMPYVESLSLGALLKAARQAGERIPPAMVSRILLDVLSGLDAAHDAKDLRGQPLEIVHRDVSPNNVLVGTDGRSRIIDFGIARAASRLCQTQSGDMKGTIAYMSPEQLRRRELDRRADVFAAGAVLYEALAGERLFDGRDEADILIGILADEIPSIKDRCSGVDPQVDDVLARSLARDRDERFPNARAFAEALETALLPAPASDVAQFIERLGERELSRRRNAIRAFVDRDVSDASLSGTHSETTAAPHSVIVAKKVYALRGFVAGTMIVVVLTLLLGGMFLNRRLELSNAVAQDAMTLSPAVTRIQRRVKIEQPADVSLREIAPFTDSSPPSLPEPLATATRSPPIVRRLGPVPEKVDKPHASELQENPYR